MFSTKRGICTANDPLILAFSKTRWKKRARKEESTVVRGSEFGSFSFDPIVQFTIEIPLEMTYAQCVFLKRHRILSKKSKSDHPDIFVRYLSIFVHYNYHFRHGIYSYTCNIFFANYHLHSIMDEEYVLRKNLGIYN